MKAYTQKTENGFIIEFEHGEKYMILTETLIQLEIEKEIAEFIKCPDDYLDYHEDDEYRKIVITKNVELFATYAKKWIEHTFHENMHLCEIESIFDYADWKSLKPIKIANKKKISQLWDECEIDVITKDYSREELRGPSLSDLIADSLVND